MASRRYCLPEYNKAVFVVEHSAASFEFSEEAFELDPSNDASKQKLRKSLWTCCVEASLEYSRIVFDLFDAEKQRIAVVATSPSGLLRTVSSFDTSNQNWSSLAARFGECKAALAKQSESAKASDASVFDNGMRRALELLSSPNQREKRARFLRRSVVEKEEEASTRGRVVVLFASEAPADMRARLERLLSEVNEAADGQERWRVQRLDVTFVRVCARPISTEEPRVMDAASRQSWKCGDCSLSYAANEWRADAAFSSQLVRLAAAHLDLLSTTISGIPMREDATATAGQTGASTNYNIEIVHSRALYAEFERVGLLAALHGGGSGTCASDAQTLLAPSVILRWNAPRQSTAAHGDQLPICMAASAFTPLDVAHRAAQCLTSGYLLQRRAAVLELPKRAIASLSECSTDAKDGRAAFSVEDPAVQNALATQFLIVAHAGRCFIHALSQPRTVPQTSSAEGTSMPPALCITETAGGRVMDYRISDFADVLKQATISDGDSEKGSAFLERATRCWPSRLTLGDSIVHNLNAAFVDALLGTLNRPGTPTLSDADVEQCTAVLRRLHDHDVQRLPLPLRAPLARLKGVRRDEQYTAMWDELEQFVCAFADASPSHVNVLEQMFTVRGLRVPDRVVALRARLERAAVRLAKRGAHANEKEKEKEKSNDKDKDKTVVKNDTAPGDCCPRTTVEPVTIPLESEGEQTGVFGAKRARFTSQNDSLVALCQRTAARNAPARRDFEGRVKQLQNGSLIAELYANLTTATPAASGKA